MEITTQINLMDKILHAFPMSPKANEPRTFAVVLHRGGITMIKSCEENAYQAQESLMLHMTRLLPFKGAHSPLHAHLRPNYVPYPGK